MLTTKTWSRTNSISTFKIFLRKQMCARKKTNMEILFLQKRKDWISEGSSCCQYALLSPLHLLATNLCALGNTEWISTKVEFNLKLMVLKHNLILVWDGVTTLLLYMEFHCFPRRRRRRTVCLSLGSSVPLIQ